MFLIHSKVSSLSGESASHLVSTSCRKWKQKTLQKIAGNLSLSWVIQFSYISATQWPRSALNVSFASFEMNMRTQKRNQLT